MFADQTKIWADVSGFDRSSMMVKYLFDLKTQKYVCDRPETQKHIYTCPIQDFIKSARPHLIGLFPVRRDVTQNSDLWPPHVQQANKGGQKSYAFVTSTQQE